MEEESSLAALLRDFAALPGRKVLVHGGGRSATAMASRLGIETRMVDGRRVTDEAMLEVVTMVYAGLVNKRVVARLGALGVKALGLTGADMDVIRSHRRTGTQVDYGFVGDVDRVNADALRLLIEDGTVPVVAPLTHDGQGQLLNTNADTMAGETAKALACHYDVTLTRTLQTGGWNSFAVPFDISSEELSAKGITAKELTGSSLLDGALTLNFTEAASIEAGKPYLVKVAETLENPTFVRVLVKKDAVTTETAAVNFVPTLGKTLVTGPAGDEDNAKAVFILGAGNKMSNPSVVNDPNSLSSYMKGFRAYFQLADNTKNVRSISLDTDEDAETAINEVHETSGAGEDLILYDLQGRRVSNTKQKGLYIVNGKKVIK